MKKILVEITACSLKMYWYADKIGEKFECYLDEFLDNFIVAEDQDENKSVIRMIDRKDGRILQDV